MFEERIRGIQAHYVYFMRHYVQAKFIHKTFECIHVIHAAVVDSKKKKNMIKLV